MIRFLIGLLKVCKIIGIILWSITVNFIRLCFKRTQPKPNFTYDIVLITGAAQGLGKELALQFSECGATVVLWDINETKLRQTCSEITAQGREAFGYVVDCSKKEQIYKAAEQVRDEVDFESLLTLDDGEQLCKDIVLITGAAQGLGKELAQQFSEHGATVVLWDINETKLRQTCSEITAQGRKAFSYVVNVAKKENKFMRQQSKSEKMSSVVLLLFLWDINETKLRQTCSEITAQGREAFGFVVDCSKKEQIYEMQKRSKMRLVMSPCW
ncbi:uncharacterized oxidoreductase YciK-like [Gigantopelta aegis]|uniref:uncharacterized oxidoreductase YciK-like n=1 Tax=Gigantopelta aegis TaxID=1735272 RepID=UPI001B88BD7A|nr:uncharacterized oxidoreductase YciK-like [Gigantopelta aegis]